MRHRLTASVFAVLVFGLMAAQSPVRADEHRRSLALISDIHFNPFDPPENARALVGQPAEEWRDVFSTIRDQPMSSWGSDTNYALLASSIDAFADKASESEFAIIVGDFLAHKFKDKAADALGGAPTDDQVQALAVKTTLFVGEAVSRALPGKPVIIALGNNDSDCGDYRIAPSGEYLGGTREMVRRLVGADLVAADFDETYAAGGYYALRHPTLPATRILVVNDILWSARYQDACGSGGEAAASAMLTWLRGELARQKAAGGSAWLVHHIPWGIDPHSTANAKEAECNARAVPFLREPIGRQFREVLLEYAETIQTSFASHIHTEDYRLLADSKSRPLIAQKIVPAISPIYFQNPGFEIVSYDAKTGVPNDFSTYYLANVDGASLAVPGDWRFEYTFSQAYGLGPYSAKAVANLIESVAAGGTAAATYRQFYDLRHAQLPQKDLPIYACAMRELETERFTECWCGD